MSELSTFSCIPVTEVACILSFVNLPDHASCAHVSKRFSVASRLPSSYPTSIDAIVGDRAQFEQLIRAISHVRLIRLKMRACIPESCGLIRLKMRACITDSCVKDSDLKQLQLESIESIDLLHWIRTNNDLCDAPSTIGYAMVRVWRRCRRHLDILQRNNQFIHWISNVCRSCFHQHLHHWIQIRTRQVL